MSPMDLDTSLDDLIKKRKSKNNNNNNNKNSNNNNKKNKNQESSRPAIQTNKAKITKTSQRASGINARLSTSTVSGPIFTAKNRPAVQQNKADPSQIIITKNIGKKTSNITKKPEVKSSSSNSNIISRLGKNSGNKEKSSSMRIDRSNTKEFTIRGRSNTDNTKPPVKKNDSGPTMVLITGLDPGVNSEDVKISFEQFGDILHCEVLRNRAGLSFGEAEVEFSTKEAALDCIAELDNQLADGRFLRIILREPKPPQSYAQKQIRSIIQPSQSSNSRYNIHRQ